MTPRPASRARSPRARAAANRLAPFGLLRAAPPAPGEDPHAAPGRYRGDRPADPWTMRRWVQNLGVVYALGALFLPLAFTSLREGDPSTAGLVLRLAVIMVIAASYLAVPWVADLSLGARCAFLVLFVGLLLLTSTFWGWSWVGYGVYVSVLLATLIPWRWSRIAILTWSLILVSTIWVDDDLTGLYIGLVGAGVALATGGGIEAGRVGMALHRAEQRVATLALAAERERIGRDLHDILGHSLTAISIKAGLAGRILDSDPRAAREQIAEVEEIARQALADVRATATAIREVRVASELAGARSVLLAAGIAADLPAAVDPLPESRSELFGFVIREAVTNVVRHSEATRCVIRVSPEEISVADDGRGLPTGSAAPGSGLTGLQHRLVAVGGELTVTSAAGAGTTVRARVPGPGTASGPQVLAGEQR